MIIKMSLKKRITASITAAALTAASVLTLSGCSQSVSRAMTVNGEDIPAGIYILYSGHAYADATQKLKEEQPKRRWLRLLQSDRGRNIFCGLCQKRNRKLL